MRKATVVSLSGTSQWRPIVDSPLLGPIIRNWGEIGLPDCWLVAGAIAQTVWNNKLGLPLTHGINDVDIIYFDPDDLSAIAEERHATRINQVFSHLPVWLDVKNEARVHLWYGAKFGYEIAPYISSAKAIATFPTTSTAVGVRPSDDNGLEIEAPFGTSDLLNLVIQPNKKQITEDIYEAKVVRWLSMWPQLTVINW